ncbi:RNA pol II accessory factor, Cdc73 family-domain-containing protein [Butyriboletus roseoflavus]|nr:RNA pol II accessory factor, Cdc73 family-domain-containing protein [Butyriboletus roseoflavus]
MDSIGDPLLALRHAIKSKTPITYLTHGEPAPTLLAATHLSLSPAITLPKSSPTRYTKPGVSNPSSAVDVYTLEAVYLAWLLRDAPGAEYMRQARESGLTVGFVSVTERKSVVEWLEGKVADLERIRPLACESTTPPGTPPRRGGTSAAPSTTPKHASHPHAADATSPSKRRYVADAQDMEVVKRIKHNEVELRDRNTVLRGTKPNNFSALHASFTERLKKLRDVKPGSAPASVPSAGPPMQARKAKNMFPIIMISSSPTALITMYNVKRFLQDAVFEPSTTARERAAAAGNPRAEDLLHIDRRRDPPTASAATFSSSTSTSSTVVSAASHGTGTGTVQRYFIVDSTDALQKFGADAWERVVCVMTTGQAWQFRPYKWNEPRTLFHHVKGIYFTWANDPPNAKIKDWNVTELKIDPHRRHIDKSVVAHFWKLIDDWTLTNKPWLLKS